MQSLSAKLLRLRIIRYTPNNGRTLRSARCSSSLSDVLRGVYEQKIDPKEAHDLITVLTTPEKVDGSKQVSDNLLQSFANLDHDRSARAGFPEAVFAQGKTADQVARILDDMARHVNEADAKHPDTVSERHSNPILATRVTPEMYNELSDIYLSHGTITYHEMGRIVSIIPSCRKDIGQQPSSQSRRRVVVATAGTTDIYVAEEAAITLEAAGCDVDRIYDCGVAGLHRIIRAIPRLRHPDVSAIIVCAGMDGALPSVVGGLVDVPVIAVPTSIGYGASFGGISAMLTMLNSCSPGVAVQNIDNGFGAAALAFKIIR